MSSVNPFSLRGNMHMLIEVRLNYFKNMKKSKKTMREKEREQTRSEAFLYNHPIPFAK